MKPRGETWINLGCGIRLLKDFINVDCAFDYEDLGKGIFKEAIIEKGAQFVRADMRSLPFPDNHADYILSHYSIEHLPMEGVVPALKEWLRVLKPDGELYIATIDFDGVMELWQGLVHADHEEWHWNEFTEVAQMIYGNQITEGEFHRCPFNPKSFNVMLSASGFPYWETRVFPAYSPEPTVKGYPKQKVKSIIKCRELHVRAFKQKPKTERKQK